MPDVSIIVISFNTRDLLRACLNAVFERQAVSTEVFVVDNCSKDGSAEMVETEFPRAILIRNPHNRGFAAANNVAIRRASGEHVLLLNPDTVLPPPTLLEMVRFMNDHQDVGICGPRILYPDGSFQSCGYAFPTLLSEIRQSKNVNRAIKAVIGDEPSPPSGSEPREAEWVDGACLMMRRAVIDAIGPLDEQYFLYGEELDWCYRTRKAGWKIYALPAVEMVHYQGKSSEQTKDTSLAHLIETRLRFYRKNYGMPEALLISLVYLAGCLKQLRREPVKSKVKMKAVLRWFGLTLGMPVGVARTATSPS